MSASGQKQPSRLLGLRPCTRSSARRRVQNSGRKRLDGHGSGAAHREGDRSRVVQIRPLEARRPKWLCQISTLPGLGYAHLAPQGR